MAFRKVTILDKAAEEVAYTAYFIEVKECPQPPNVLLMMPLPILKLWEMTGSNINPAKAIYGIFKITVVLIIRRNLWSLILMQKQK
ncbi:MAG: hypothetical protein ACHQK8_04200 [Bacteroidia bacterium]